MKLLAIAVLLAALAPNATAQTAKTSNAFDERWTFHSYPAALDFRGKPHAPDLITPKELTYQTQIRDQAKKGPNFAGHYTIAEWGCGSSCVAFVVVDARFGTTFDPGFTVGCADKNGMDAKIDFRLSSRLVIATSYEEGLGCGTGYYEWYDRGLQQVYFKPWRYGHRSRRTVTGLPRYMTDMFQPVPEFPGAPPTVRSVDCFRSFTHNNSVADVAGKCGDPDEHQGSGIFIFIYDMDDGSIVAIGATNLEHGLMYAQHVSKKGVESLLTK